MTKTTKAIIENNKGSTVFGENNIVIYNGDLIDVNAKDERVYQGYVDSIQEEKIILADRHFPQNFAFGWNDIEKIDILRYSPLRSSDAAEQSAAKETIDYDRQTF